MARCRVGLPFLVLVVCFSSGQSQDVLPWPKIDLTARGVTCDMSSTRTIDSFQNDCYAAINGNTERDYKAENCIHTASSDRSPFWLVDMGRTYRVHHIRIYTRAGYEGRSSYLTVTIDKHEVYTSPSTVTDEYVDTNSPPLPVTGRLLRITRNDPASPNVFLNICEVQVWGETCNGYLTSPTCSEHVSCGQSSIYSASPGSSVDGRVGTSADCHAAIDGNTNTRWVRVDGTGPPNCFSTALQQHPYWWVDLGRTVNIHNITMYIEYHGRLNNAIVNLDGQHIFTFTPPSNRQNPYHITRPLPRAGRNISVQYPPSVTSNEIVVLCEVQVWGCPVNKYGGPYCEQSCSVNCNDNGGETTCDSISGNCLKGCKTGWWGGRCDWSCPQQCSPGWCDTNSGCQQCAGKFATPLCTDCQSGWWGDRCDLECPQHCSSGRCNRNSGCTQCINHYTPPNCTDCQAGWWGSDCNQTCPAQCSTPGRCDRNGCAQCNNHYAAPLCTACQSGWWGSQCIQECPQRCSSGRCDRNSGCTLCDNHFIAPDCTTCVAGRYGQDCGERCSNGCNGTCSTTDGTCTCLTGWTGDRCYEAATDSSNAGGVAGGLVGALIVIAIVVVVVVIVFRRRRRAKRRDSADDMRGITDTGFPHLPSITQPEAQKTRSSKHEKPRLTVRPMKRNGAETEEPTAVPIYGNISQASSIGEPDETHDLPPALAPKPRGIGSSGKASENLPLSSPQGQTCTESATETSHSGVGPGRAVTSAGDADDLSEVLIEEEDDVNNTEDLYAVYKNTRPQVDALQQFLIDALASGELSGQFKKFAKGMKLPHNDGMTVENVRKNRFKAMCAYDFNRVHLHRPKDDPESDYINASCIKGCRGDKQYIATQGPRENCVADLWWMVWQEKVTQMVMLTNIKEDGKDKCEQYWPASGKKQTYGHVTVRALEVQERSDYVIRPFLLKAKGTSAERQVIQYHYNTWPDHGVPQAAALVDFWRYVKARGDPTVPLLVHCSAGVGRTGTFIALDIASEREALGREVNVKDIVTELREQRCIMVQSEAQYKFLHEVILVAHTSRDTRIRADKLEEIFPVTISVDKPEERIDGEFKMLQEMGKHAPKPKHTMAEMEENRNKNRNQDALPDDNHLAYLTVHVRGRNQYINAVHMSSFLHRRGLLLTQLPIPNNTMVDFWRLVDGCDVKTVVSLGSEDEQDAVEDFCQFWPLTPGAVLDSEHYSITLTSYNKLNRHLLSYGLTLRTKTENKEHPVQLYRYKAWAGEVPDDTASLLQLVDTIKARAEDDVMSPVVIQCIDGAAKSSLFCGVYNIINRVTYDDEIDVYLTARHVQTVRPQAVSTEKQYRFLYQVTQEYTRQHNVYQNTGVA